MHDRRLAAAVFVIVFITYAWFFGGAGWNQNSSFDLTRAIVEQHTIRIDGLPSNTGDYSRIGNRIYSNKPPGLSLLAVIPYAIAHAIESEPASPMSQIINLWICTVTTCAVPGALLASMFFLYARRQFDVSPRAALLVTFVLAFGTYLFAYSTVFFGHVPSALFLFASFALARRKPLLSGACAGMAVLCNYLAIVALPAIAFLVIAERRRAIARWLLGGAPLALILLAYQYAAFGSPWRTASETSNPSFIGKGLFLGLFQLPQPHALFAITFSAYRGLFFISPVLLLALIGAVKMWRSEHRRELGAIAFIVIAFFLANASFNGWNGGAAIGPRYVLPIVPFLGVLMLFAANLFRSLWIALATISIAINFIATAVNPLPAWIIERPVDRYLFPLFITGHLPRDTPPRPIYDWKIMPGHVSVVSWAPDEGYPFHKHASGTRESFWSSFNLGEIVWPGSLLSILPIALWMLGASALVIRRAADLSPPRSSP